jgi:hypothetical protein
MARAWLVRKLHVAIAANYRNQFPEIYCQLPVSGIEQDELEKPMLAR